MAARSANAVIVLAAVVLVLVAVLSSWLTQYQAARTESAPCSGYAGLPSHSFIRETGDRATAQSYCRSYQPLISISIKNKHFISLQKRRLQALDTGILVTSDEDYVPAHIAFEGEFYKAKIRLKGDWAEHVENAKRWSLRVILTGGEHIMGRKRFSLQTFAMRGHDKDPVYAEHLASIGLITPRYKPVQLQVNGQDWGTMVMEDHFSRELMEARRHKESVLGRFDESAMWLHRYQYPDFGPYDNVFTSPFKPFNGRVIRKSAVLQHYNRYVASLLAGWQEGRLALVDILDLDKYIDYIVASEAWDGWHTFRWHNMRFYCNPYTMKIEPLPFDNGWGVWPITMAPVQATVTGSQILGELFDSPRFWQQLERRMPEVLSQLQQRSLWQALQNQADYLESLLVAEGDVSRFNLDVVKQNLNYLSQSGADFFHKQHKLPEPAPLDNTRKFHSMVKLSAYDNGTIVLSNKLPFAVAVKQVNIVGDLASRSALEQQGESLRLPPTPIHGRPQVLRLQVEDLQAGETVVVTSVNEASGQIASDSSDSLLHYFDDASSLEHWSPEALPGSVELPDFIQSEATQWTIPAGNWTLERGLVVPAHITLTIAAGARITASPGSFILSRGMLHMQGTEAEPVVITGVAGDNWRGIYLLNVGRASHWQHAQLSDLSAFGFDNFTLSGALNSYRSDLKLDNVTIERVDAEDAINVVQSAFTFTHLRISQVSSDAIDADFSDGQIVASSFVDVGGDGIDTSGSIVSIRDVALARVVDKAISIGEASRMDIQHADIRQVGVAIAAKDYSEAKIQSLQVADARVAAVMAYSKKPEYGGAFLEITGFQAGNVANVVINQTGSTVLLNGSEIAPRKVNVDYYYQQGLMPK